MSAFVVLSIYIVTKMIKCIIVELHVCGNQVTYPYNPTTKSSYTKRSTGQIRGSTAMRVIVQ